MKKIMFNDKYGLTEAVLQGRKTMTRRIIADKDEIDAMVYARGSVEKKMEYILSKSRYKIGEVVAVAQSYKQLYEERKIYVEDWVRKQPAWNNKMYVRADLMPHQIQITDIKVERLQDISDEDCMREGLIKGLITYGIRFKGGDLLTYLTPREAFADLIDAVSGKGTWESNPWVFAYSFELCK